MNRLLVVPLSRTLLVALGLLACDRDEKPTGPNQPAPAAPAIAHPPALVSPHSGPSQLPEPGDIALPGLLPGPSGSAVPRPSLDLTDLEQATEVVWGSILGTEPSDPVVARLLADVPVLMSGIRQIKGRTYLYLGIGRAYFNRHGGEHIYNTLTRRFPTVPLYIEPSDGVRPLSATLAAPQAASATDTPASVAPAGKAVATVDAPAEPTNLRVEALTDTSAQVRWDAVAGATDYDVNYKPAVGGRWTNEPHRGVGLSNTIDDLAPNTEYRWAVRAENRNGPSDWVFGDNFTTLAEGWEPAQGSNLTVQSVAAIPTTVTSGSIFTLRATIRNNGDAASSQTVTAYRHTSRATNPRSGTQAATAITGSLAAGASVTKSLQITAPTVATQTTYHYYVCTDDACASDQVIVTPKEVTKTTEVIVEPVEMGGDGLGVYYHINDPEPDVDAELPYTGGTLTLGGLTTTDGTKGFVASGHGISKENPFEGVTRTDTYVFGGIERYHWSRNAIRFLGKVMRLPQVRDNFFYADAGFVAYPSLTTLNCSLTWTGDDTGKIFCLDLGKGDQVETVTPLAIRGKNDTVYTVIGSQEPTMGLGVMFSGATSGTVEGNQVTSGAILGSFSEEVGHYYLYDLDGGGESAGGDSGSPIYTVPDRNGNVRIVGILYGSAHVAGEKITTFSSWSDVEKELDLQPISP